VHGLVDAATQDRHQRRKRYTFLLKTGWERWVKQPQSKESASNRSPHTLLCSQKLPAYAMYRKYANNVLVVLVSALSVTSIILTHKLFAFKNVQFETDVMKKEYSQLHLIPSDPL